MCNLYFREYPKSIIEGSSKFSANIADAIFRENQMITEMFAETWETFNNTECPKKMYTHKVNIPYYNVYTSFWNTL
jgi:hypothetical protein